MMSRPSSQMSHVILLLWLPWKREIPYISQQKNANLVYTIEVLFLLRFQIFFVYKSLSMISRSSSFVVEPCLIASLVTMATRNSLYKSIVKCESCVHDRSFISASNSNLFRGQVFLNDISAKFVDEPCRIATLVTMATGNSLYIKSIEKCKSCVDVLFLHRLQIFCRVRSKSRMSQPSSLISRV